MARNALAATRKRSRLGLEERRHKLLDLGLELFSTRPYDDVSTDDIARAAGISKGLMYHYFPGKREFYVATLRLASSRLDARTEADPSLPKPMRLYAGLAAYLDYVDVYAPSYVALLKGGIGSDPAAAAIVEESRERMIRRVLDALGVGEPRPALRLALRGWIGFVEHASLDWLVRRDVPKESLLQMLVAAIAAALTTAQSMDPAIVLDVEG